MQIMSKKRYCFKNGNDVVITEGQNIIQTVPDWVAETPLYAIAEAGGNIVELADKGRAVTEAAQETLEESEQPVSEEEQPAEQPAKPPAKAAKTAKK